MDVGGSSSGDGWACFTGTRFRPLSFNLAKPLFPLAGQPMVHHPILACQKVPYKHAYHIMGRRKTERSHRWEFIVCPYNNNNNNNNPIPGALQWRNHMDSNGGMSFMFVWSNRKKNPASLQFMFFSLHAWDLFAPQLAHGLPLSSLLEQVLTLVLSFFLVVTRYPIWPKCFWLDFTKNGNSRFISRPSQMNWRFLWCKQCPLLCTFSSSELGRLLQVPNLSLDSCTFTSTPTWIQSSYHRKKKLLLLCRWFMILPYVWLISAVIIKHDTPTFRVCASQVLARRKASWISWWTLQLQGSSYGGGSCNSFHSPVFMSKLLVFSFFVSWVSNQFMQSVIFFFLKICGARALGLNCKKTAFIDRAFWLCTWIDCWKKGLLFYHGAHHHVWKMIFLEFCSMIFSCWTAMCAAAFL